MTGADPRTLSLEGRLALVTGAGGAIGGAVATLFAAAGAEVLCVDLPGTSAPEGLRSIPCDLSSSLAVRQLFEGVRQISERLDILVHCAGITRDGVLWKLTDEDWSRVLQVNLDSAFYLLREAAPAMRAHGGSIALVSSINGERGKFGQANYTASKAGLIGLAKTAARELGRFGVRVNVISPGLIRSAMTQDLPEEVLERARAECLLGRIGEPEEVARAAYFLCSDLSAFVTGQVLRVDGGQLIA